MSITYANLEPRQRQGSSRKPLKVHAQQSHAKQCLFLNVSASHRPA